MPISNYGMSGNMHPYSIDNNERVYIPFYLAVASILSALAVPQILQFINVAVPSWLDAPAVMGFYGIYYKLFQEKLWRIRWIRKLTGVKVPNLNGNWEGGFNSSFFQSSEDKQPATIQIQQNWTHISILFKNGSSRSKSISTAVITNNPYACEISYEYQNEPNYNALETMHIHKGFTRFTLSKDEGNLVGEYFTGRSRQNYGTLYFQKID
jgi:hypothetical protein